MWCSSADYVVVVRIPKTPLGILWVERLAGDT